MPTSAKTRLFAYFDQLGIVHETLEHAATFTVEEGRDLKAHFPGGHSKNLFMKDKAGTIVLISAHVDSELRLNQLHRHIGTKRLSFAPESLMVEILGVRPGAVTAFALMNDIPVRVRFILDKALADFDQLCFHPLVNTATTRVSRTDFDRFVRATGHNMEIVDFTALA